MIVNIEPSWADSIEHQCLSLSGCKCIVAAHLQPDTIGIGSVEYCRAISKWSACDPYPPWIPLKRRTYREQPLTQPAFYKPADIPKRFKSEILNAPPNPPWIATDVVKFIKEYRAYVINSTVKATYCYSDWEDSTSHPFPWKIPPNITAAIDFGITDTGVFDLVEVNDPYAVGWYGSLSDYKTYSEFVISGWKLMITKEIA